MDFKNLSLSDKLSSATKKAVSGFGLGLTVGFILFSVLLYSSSFKTPYLNFQGWNSVDSSSNSSFLSWPWIGGVSSNNASINTVSQNDTVEAARNQSSSSYWGTRVSDDSRLGNVSNNVEGGSSLNKIAEGIELENVTKGHLKGKNMSENSVEEAGISNAAKLEYEGKGNTGNFTYNGDNAGLRNTSSYNGCDIFNGRWVNDNSKPYYPPGSCPYIDKDFECHLNGRPDDEFVKWKWQPDGCDIPSFNSTDFLERLSGKKLVFVGDSLNRNMWESLVCMLRHGVKNKEQVYEISGRHEFKKKGFYAFRFEDYNCSIDFVASPFLVKESVFNGKNGSFETLRLDLMDSTTSMYHDADVLVFNTGHWWTHEKTSRGENYYQEGEYVHPRLKVLEAYKRALATWASWVDKNINPSKTQVIFRGYSVAHFRGGPWNSGGQCHNETVPIFNDRYLIKYPKKMKMLEYVLKDMKTPVTYLNISRLTDYRKDGHPSIYRPGYQATQQEAVDMHVEDCSHWCLPGVPDAWNELLYVSLLQTGQGSWRN